MLKFVLALSVGSAIVATAPLSSWGADLSAGPRMAGIDRHCRQIRVCGPRGCEWRRSCWNVCQGGREARYTCGALYGAYGPWGGAGYWDAYTVGY